MCVGLLLLLVLRVYEHDGTRGAGCRVHGSQFTVQGAGCRVLGSLHSNTTLTPLHLRVQASGFSQPRGIRTEMLLRDRPGGSTEGRGGG